MFDVWLLGKENKQAGYSSPCNPKQFFLSTKDMREFFLFLLHICEGDGGKHCKPFKISTASLREV